MISAVGVVVPARNEENHIARCLDSLATALAQLPPGVAHAVTLVLDRCEDNTAQNTAATAARHPALRLEVVTNRGTCGVGSLRDLGLRRSLRALGHRPTDEIWLLSTDADSHVTPGWVLDHVRHADRGADAVAGMVELDDPASLGPNGRARYERLVAGGVLGGAHSHVYAANLGVRADAYLAVGGFPATGSGEDHGLVRRLRAAGHPVVSATDTRVQTSARLVGRATGGLADLLDGLRSDGPHSEGPHSEEPRHAG